MEDLKNAWSQYDKKLQDHLKLNEEVLRSLNFEKYNNALMKPLHLEWLNIFIQFVMAGVATGIAISLFHEPLFFLAGIAGAMLCAASLVFSLIRAGRMQKLLYHHLNVLDFQKGMEHLKIMIIRFRRVEYLLAPLIGVTLFPLLLKAVAGINLYSQPALFILLACLVIGIGFVTGMMLNATVYDKGIRDAETFLHLLGRYAKEE